MVTQEYHDRIKGLRRAFSAAKSSVDRKDYVSAFAHLRTADLLTPKNYEKNDPSAPLYDAAKTRIDLWYEAILNHTKRSFNQAYNKASEDLDRMARGRNIPQSTIRAIKDMESSASKFNVDDLPQEIKFVVEDQLSRIANLKKELETYAKSKGVKIYWGAE